MIGECLSQSRHNHRLRRAISLGHDVYDVLFGCFLVRLVEVAQQFGPGLPGNVSGDSAYSL